MWRQYRRYGGISRKRQRRCGSSASCGMAYRCGVMAAVRLFSLKSVAGGCGAGMAYLASLANGEMIGENNGGKTMAWRGEIKPAAGVSWPLAYQRGIL
jgi:hypothetical protein